MWDETLIESRAKTGGDRHWRTVVLSAFFHTMIVVTIIGASYWYLEAVEPINNRRIDAWTVAAAPPSEHVIPAIIKRGTSRGNDIPAQQKPFVQEAELSQAQIQPGTDFSQSETPVAQLPFDPEAGRPEGNGPRGSEQGNSEEGALWAGGSEQSEQPIVIRTGVQPPVLVQRVQPEYPDIMRQARVQGVVVLSAVISKNGDVEVKEVLRSLHPILDREAIRAVNQWKYSPATVGNRPVAVWFTVTVSYRLR